MCANYHYITSYIGWYIRPATTSLVGGMMVRFSRAVCLGRPLYTDRLWKVLLLWIFHWYIVYSGCLRICAELLPLFFRLCLLICRKTRFAAFPCLPDPRTGSRSSLNLSDIPWQTPLDSVIIGSLINVVLPVIFLFCWWERVCDIREYRYVWIAVPTTSVPFFEDSSLHSWLSFHL